MHVSVLFSILALVAYAKDSEKMNKYYERTGKKFLQEIEKKKGIIKLKSGLLVEILKENPSQHAKSPESDDPCDVTYSGTLKDGTEFDSSRTTFRPSQVIAVSTP